MAGRQERSPVLPSQHTAPTCERVSIARHPLARQGLLVVGLMLVLVSPVVGVIPGPGGILVFAGGLALILRNSLRAKREFVMLKRRWPKLGEIADRGLRRASAARRRARDQARRAN